MEEFYFWFTPRLSAKENCPLTCPLIREAFVNKMNFTLRPFPPTGCEWGRLCFYLRFIIWVSGQDVRLLWSSFLQHYAVSEKEPDLMNSTWDDSEILIVSVCTVVVLWFPSSFWPNLALLLCLCLCDLLIQEWSPQWLCVLWEHSPMALPLPIWDTGLVIVYSLLLYMFLQCLLSAVVLTESHNCPLLQQ